MRGPAERFGRSIAVVIGIDMYGDGIAPLRSAVADAKAVAEALQRDHGFEPWCLFNDDARLPALLVLLRERLPAALGPEDRLLLYFAGHGIALDSDVGPAGYLVPAGAQRSEPERFLPMRVLHEALTQLPVRHALVILDCCFAGTFRWASLRDVSPSSAKIYRERYDRYIESAAWQVLTSASGDQLALDMLANDRGEGVERHSPFARALLDGLAGAADLTKDNLITADELAIYVRERVAPAAESMGRRQIPHLFPLDRHDCGQFVFQVPDRVLALARAPALEERANPYRGLASFHEEDRGLFFGRDAVVERLVGTVTARPLTVVVGPSGSGKSSVVHAGLLPALRAKGWEILPTQRPGREPLALLDAWTHALGSEAADGGAGASWTIAVAARERARPDQPWLVVIDQLEELLTHRTAESDRRCFLEALASALRAAPRLHLVVTIRSDAEPQLHDTALAPWWTIARFAVPAMTREELRQIIERPASVAVLHFEPSRLIERLLDDVALVPAPLPLLSFALSELYRRCWTRWQEGAHDRAMRGTDYDEMGSVARALTQRATAVQDQLVAEDGAYAVTIRNVFVRMVAIVGGEVARRRVSRYELVYEDAAENRRIDDVLQRFHEARLISLGTEPLGTGAASAYAEPTHDELVRGWTKVCQWLDELDAMAGTRALLGALGDAVRSWVAHGQADSYLWGDPRVEVLSELGRERPLVFNADEAEFVNRGVRRRRTRRVRLIGGLIAVIAVLTVAAGVAFWQQQRATEEAERANWNADRAEEETKRANQNKSDADQQRATANSQRDEANRQRDEASRQRDEANRQRDEANRQRDESRRLLGQQYQEVGRKYLLEGDPESALPYLMATRQLSVKGEAIRMLIAAATHSLPLRLEHQKGVWSAAFSRDGARVMTESVDAVRVWDAATGELLAVPVRDRSVTSSAFSPDDTRVVIASAHAAYVWDVASGRPLANLRHQLLVASAMFSPDGTRVVTASFDRTAQVWDAITGKPLGAPLVHRDAVLSAAFSPDSTRVVTASSDNTARVWDAATGKPLAAAFEHQGWVGRAAFSPDGTRVATASTDNTARVWDAVTGTPLGALLRHRDVVFNAAFSPDGSRVVTASDDHTARVWDAATGEPVAAPLQHQGRVRSAAFSPDGTRVVTASFDHTARVWDVATGKPLAAPLQHQGGVSSAAFSPDGTRVVTASDNIARVWDVAIGKPLAAPFQNHREVISSDGTRVVTTSDDDTVRVWDATTGKSLTAPFRHPGDTVRVYDGDTGKPDPCWQQGACIHAALSPDGRRVVTVGYDKAARVWDAATGTLLAEFLPHRDARWSVAFSPDGTRVVTASDDHTARVWDAVTGKPLAPPLRHQDTVESASFSPDGTRVVTAGADNTARVWDAATGMPLAAPLRHQGWGTVESASFSPDGTRVVTASTDRTSRVWDATTGKPLTVPLQHQGSVASAAFSRDGRRLITTSNDHTVRVWDAAAGTPLAGPLQHQGNVNSGAFSADGTRVVTASDDHTARVWDAATGMPLAAPLQHQNAVESASFSADGTRVVTVSDHTAYVWETPLETPAAKGAALARQSPFVLRGGGLVLRDSHTPRSR